MEPVVAKERVILLDVLRGFAIFGMFIVNMTRDTPWGGTFWKEGAAVADKAAIIFVDLLLNGRFITIFSILFGIGFYIQLQRAKARDTRFIAIYLRRLLGLMLIACLCVVAGLQTHILIDYAIFGFVLFFFRNLSPRTLLFLSMFCFFVAKTPALIEMYGSPPSVDIAAQQLESSEQRIYVEGSLPDIVILRAKKLRKYLTSVKQRLSDFDILAMMLIGFYLGRRGFVYDSDTRLRFARRILPWLTAIGTSGVIGFVYIEHFLSSLWDELPLESLKWLIGWNFGMVLLGMAYAAGITILMQQTRWEKCLVQLAPVGQLALSNYVFTNLVYAVLTYGWGFSLYGQMRPITGLLIVVLLIPVQIACSQWWIQRFKFGPLEWCWRSMTYGNLQPIRVK